MADADHGPRPDEKFIRVERMALFEVLDRFPAHLRIEDLTGRITRFKTEPGFGDTEEVREGVAELVGFGLVSRLDRFVIPTPAALHFDLLIEGH